MKVIRAAYDGKEFYAVLENAIVKPLKKEPYEAIEFTGESIPAAEVKLLAPCEPSKVVCVGLNYKKHFEEIGESLGCKQNPVPIIFLKPSTSVIAPGEPIVRPVESEKVDYEGELAVVVGKKARNVRAEDVDQYIFGYTCLNDVTARDFQKLDGQWTRGKGYDTFCPMGPHIETQMDASDVNVQLTVNGEVHQNASTRLLINNITDLFTFITGFMTLLPGDVIATGTPEGVGPIVPGDVVTVSIEGIGDLTNPVI